jgi:hypothetical protein
MDIGASSKRAFYFFHTGPNIARHVTLNFLKNDSPIAIGFSRPLCKVCHTLATRRSAIISQLGAPIKEMGNEDRPPRGFERAC